MAQAGSTMAILAAVLFGISTPLAKLLVHDLSPWMLAGLLYLGSGIGLGLVRLARGLSASQERNERSIHGIEWFWLLAAVFAGGVAGPVLLMFGLTATPASTASLLLNLEGVLTALLAWFVFQEGFDRRLVAGMVAIVAGAVVLSWGGTVDIAAGWGPAAVAAASLMWAVDNNLTRKVSLADPVDIATIKGLVAGSVNVGIASVLGDGLPALPTAAAAMLVGLLGYGVSLVLFVIALRHIGTARTGAYFSTAPFVGAIASLAMFDEPLTAGLIAAAVLMGIGVWLHLTEDHDHEHDHNEIEHDHPHVHDEHHQHGHDGPVTEPHTHKHRHGRLRHRHAHFPDAHHVHPH
ncbi:DMT family transporter [Azospirillum rugosum]|uniref:Drug/metabolite transporter (DMT)-like permease n=2 Tax=Azospirillum rugosum TaxID=416170 RepID=A0ABS4SXI4_9PROT|nr:DMT family transporter [Azospirillum rugosum]MBP2297269.1 drug/metabolite transporter (DMT)-like permease [Azospirillum rugosum]MDQ0531111.1 drug/metabolite transporter (DMT)-like permease [Azospirillum rugosum]